MSILTFSCGNNSSSSTKKSNAEKPELINPYLASYSGGYMIMVNGVNNSRETEMYVLHKNSIAEWKYISLNAAGQARIDSEKSGTWTASENMMKISINGKTGVLEETYTRDDGVFRYGDRYLKKTN